MLLKGRKIGWSITGSFCTLEGIVKIMEDVKNEGAEIFPFVSNSVMSIDTRFGEAKEWISKIEDMTGKKVVSSISEAEPFGPLKMLDVMLVSPCTGNTLAKIANAITDTPVTMACKAHIRNNRPLIISISTNDALGANAKNIGMLLNMKNIYFVPFRQDDPVQKCNSLVSSLDKTIPALVEALKGNQIQPMIL